MINVRHILRLHTQGYSKLKIAMQTGEARNTLKKYLAAFAASGLNFGQINVLSAKELKKKGVTRRMLGILGASQLTYVEGVMSQQKEDFIAACENTRSGIFLTFVLLASTFVLLHWDAPGAILRQNPYQCPVQLSFCK